MISNAIAGPSSRQGISSLVEDDMSYLTLPFPHYPPGSFHSSADDDNNDIQVLDEAPGHMRKRTNKDKPIYVDDSDEDVVDETGPSTPPSKRKRIRLEAPSPVVVIDPQPKLEDLESFPEAGGSKNNGQQPLSQEVTGNVAADLLSSVVAILPDIDTTWALDIITTEIQSGQMEGAVGKALNAAFEMEDGYPKAVAAPVAAGKGKGKSKEEEADYRTTSYRRIHRSGFEYRSMSEEYLADAFPLIPMESIRKVFEANGYLLVPTYFALRKSSAGRNVPYKSLKRGRQINGRAIKWWTTISDRFGPGAMADSSSFVDEQDYGAGEAIREYTFLDGFLAKERIEQSAIDEKAAAREQALADGHGLECGCCFGEEIIADMFQCTEGHLFCRECATRHAETQLGDQKFKINCMDGSDCTAAFPESELKRLLSENTLSLYHRLKLAAELDQAKIDGLESCPACPFSAIIENQDEKLFHCMNPQCKQVSCRKCQKPSHIPKSCEEVEADRKLDGRHRVEEAMTEALLRKCPKCSKPYLKDSGCNKIICTGCGTKSCYICQKVVHGYEHFDQRPHFEDPFGAPKSEPKCRLWDTDEALNDQRTVVAARNAAQVIERGTAEDEGVVYGEEDLDVAAPAVAQNPPAHPVMPHYHHYMAFQPVGNEAQRILDNIDRDMARLRGRLRAEGPPRMARQIPGINGAHVPEVGPRPDELLEMYRERFPQEELNRQFRRRGNPPPPDPTDPIIANPMELNEWQRGMQAHDPRRKGRPYVHIPPVPR